MRARPFSDFDASATAQVDSRVTIHPSMLKSFANLGLTMPEAFLAIPGEIVSGHPDRHVMRVVLGDGQAAYLKREHRIRWKDRFRNWRADFGWIVEVSPRRPNLARIRRTSTARPAMAGFRRRWPGTSFPAPRRNAPLSIDLRRCLAPTWPTRLRWLMRLGRFCAELHQSNVDHPDLCAKHFLIDPATRAITLLDWQRATIGQPVEWPRRIRAVAALLATLPDSENHWDVHFLWSYLRAVRGQGVHGVPKFSAARALRYKPATRRLLCRRGIREQRQPPLDRSAQRLVWIDGEALCAVPEVAANLSQAMIREMLYDPARNQQPILLAEGRPAHLEVGVHRALLSRVISWLRRKSWRSPEFRKARLLFHLERHHVPAAKLLAYGQRCQRLQAKAFLLTETVESSPLNLALRRSRRGHKAFAP